MIRRGFDVTPELQAAEVAGKEALRAWFRAGVGRQIETARRTGIAAGNLSRMASDPVGTPIGLEHAVLIEVASEGGLRAEVLCPSRADVLGRLLALRAGEGSKA